jgi:hypothetical protein
MINNKLNKYYVNPVILSEKYLSQYQMVQTIDKK